MTWVTWSKQPLERSPVLTAEVERYEQVRERLRRVVALQRSQEQERHVQEQERLAAIRRAWSA